MSRRSWEREIAMVRESTGCDTCIWKGRMAAWMAAVGKKQLLHDVANCTSEKLQSLLLEAGDCHADAQAMLTSIRNLVLETLHEKLSFWDHIPWRACAIFYPYLPGVDSSIDVGSTCSDLTCT